MSAIPSNWQTLYAEGKTYYYNTQTRETTWEKPHVLLTPLERALEGIPWKETSIAGSDQKYYIHKVTKETVWEMPSEYKAIIDKFSNLETSTGGSGTTHIPTSATALVFSSKEQAFAAFHKLLSEQGVTIDWTWEEMICAVVTSPVYRALTMPERREAFDKYLTQRKDQEKMSRVKRFEADREKLRRLFKTREEITGSTKYRAMCSLLGSDPTLRSTIEEFREKIFDEYVAELRKREKDIQREARKEQLSTFRDLLKSLELTLDTKWSQAKPLFESHRTFASLNHLDSMDTLITFEEFMNSLEKKFYKDLDQQFALKKRIERKKRQAFKDLLASWVSEGKIKMYSKFKDLRNEFAQESAYLNMLGQSGSTPLDLFRDVIVSLQSPISKDLKEILSHPSIHDSLGLNFQEFINILPSHSSYSTDVLRTAYEDYKMFTTIKNHLDKRQEEKKLKKRMDAFKSCLKRLDPPITLKSKWEEVAVRVSHKSDYRELEEEDRVIVFNKLLNKLSGDRGDRSDRDKKRHKSSRRRSRSLESSTSHEDEKRKRKRDKRESQDVVMKDRIVIERTRSDVEPNYSTEEGEIME